MAGPKNISQFDPVLELDGADYFLIWDIETGKTVKVTLSQMISLIAYNRTVNGKGDIEVVLSADDIDDSNSLKKFLSSAEKLAVAKLKTNGNSDEFLAADGQYRAPKSGLISIPVADIAGRDLLTGLDDGQLVIVRDATGDPSVTTGGAVYSWNASGGVWDKISEIESLDWTIATQAAAEAGSDNATMMTPLRTFQAWIYSVANKTVSSLNTVSKTIVGAINELRAYTGASLTGPTIHDALDQVDQELQDLNADIAVIEGDIVTLMDHVNNHPEGGESSSIDLGDFNFANIDLTNNGTYNVITISTDQVIGNIINAPLNKSRVQRLLVNVTTPCKIYRSTNLLTSIIGASWNEAINIEEGTYYLVIIWWGTGAVDFNLIERSDKNAGGPVQLSAVTIGTILAGDGQLTIPFDNPNNGNESQNQIYYRLSTDTEWIQGVVGVTGSTEVIQTGITNGLSYDVKIVAEGDDINYTDSNDSNIVSQTPTSGLPKLVSPTIQGVIPVSTTSIKVIVDDPNDSPNESNVLFRMATNSGMSVGLVTSQQPSGTLSHIFDALTTGQTYYFDVIHEGDGITTDDSNPSVVVSGVPQLIIMSDTFDGTVIDTDKWVVSAPSSSLELSQNEQLIGLMHTNLVAGSANIKSKLTNDKIVAASKFGGTFAAGDGYPTFRITGKTGYYAMIQSSGTGLATLIIYSNGTEVYNQTTSKSFKSRWRISYDKTNNEIKFEWYENVSQFNWQQQGATQVVDLDPDNNLDVFPYIYFHSVNTNHGDVTMTMDDFYLTNDTYINELPS